MKTVLIDSSSAILLFKIGLFDLLVRTYRIQMTQAVYNEICLPGYPGAGVFKNHCREQRITVIPSIADAKIVATMPPALRSLDSGEKETIWQYTRADARFIIIDDRRGGAYCRDHRIPYVNALLIVRIFYLSGTISKIDYRSKSTAVIEQGRYTPDIIEYGLGCPQQRLVHFMP
jgi:hypothetical protein